MVNAFAKETDGFFARHFDRRISGVLSRFLLKTPITPNQITVFVTGLGIGAGWFMAQPGDAPKVIGSFLFLLTSILDGCDGEVARAKNLTSKLGGWLDLWGDNVVHVAVFYGVAVGLWRDSGNTFYLTLGKTAVGGTLMSAALVSFQTWRKGLNSFTSVSGDIQETAGATGWRGGLVKFSDALARRDFVYGVVALSLISRLEWFLWACALGSVLYALVLGVLCLLTRKQ